MAAPARRVPLPFRTVVFDCDSTLTTVEGIDELAGGDPAVARLTEAAMAGRVPLDEVYGERLARVRPDAGRLAALGRLYTERLVEDAADVVAALTRSGVSVHLISGGLLPAVLQLASALDVPADRVHAVAVAFDDAGGYAGYDHSSPLARAGGKLALLQELGDALAPPVMLVGDGMTDLEAAPAVDLFVAYAAVAERPQVVHAADIVLRDASLAPVLALALPVEDVEERHRTLWHRGRRLLNAARALETRQ